nr:HAMP domain-containing protein [Anaerolinea sp.]
MPLHHPWTPPSTPWHAAREHKRRFLFWRFARLMAGMFLVFLVGLAIFLFVLYKPLSQARLAPWVIILTLCGVPLVFVGLAGALGGWGLRRMGAPLVDVMSAADAVAEGDLSVRVRENVPGEFGRLARSFNRMTAELDRAEQQRRNLTADVAHELRTPLHIIQGNLEGVLDGVYQPTPEHIAATLEETRLLARLVNDLRTLSLAEAGQLALHLEPLDVNDLLEDALTRFSGQAAAQQVELALAVTGDNLNIRADHDRLDQVITNLVANALEHTP